MAAGKLILIPTYLHESFQSVLLPNYLVELRSIRHFIVENVRTTRRYLKHLIPELDINSCTFWEINDQINIIFGEEIKPAFLQGATIALLSEAGCPGIADPGTEIVKLCHTLKIKIVPWIGPSSIPMALMASGMNGQGFTFHGYLPIQAADLEKKLKELGETSVRDSFTQIFIETPYRNTTLLKMILSTVPTHLRLCICTDLSGISEWIQTASIAEWKEMLNFDLHKRATIFLLGAP